MMKLEDSMRVAGSLIGFAAIALCLVASHVAAASDFDGSRNLLCAPTDAIQCEGAGECSRKEVELLNMAKFLDVDFKARTIKGTIEGGTSEQKSEIQTVQKLEGTTLIQGAENGRGWSLIVDKGTGDMTLAIAGDDLAFVLFGVCRPR